jgi:hypothetical protein
MRDEEVQGPFDLALIRDKHIVENIAENFARQLAGLTDGDPLRQSKAANRPVSPVIEIGKRRKEIRLHPYELDIRFYLACREPAASGQTTPADRQDQRVEIGIFGEHLAGQRSLPGQNHRVVERVDENRSGLRGQRQRMRLCRIEIRARDIDLCSKRPGLVYFHHRRAFWHDDGRCYAHRCRMARNALGVVAGRCGHHALAALRLAQGGKAGIGAAFLEGSGRLEVFKLHDDITAQRLGERRRRQAGRAQDAAHALFVKPADEGEGASEIAGHIRRRL